MENNNDNTGNTNWTPPATGTGTQGGQELPNAKSGFTMGLVGLIMSFFCCCGLISIVGLVLSIMGFMKTKEAIQLYESNPGMYDEASYKKAKTGKTLALIGLIIAAVSTIWFILSYFLQLGGDMYNFDRMMRRMRYSISFILL